MKRICFITTVSLTLDSFVLDFAKYLHNNTDWDISFICNNDPAFAEKIPDYIHYFPVKMERGISFSGFTALIKMINIFREQKFDLIQYSTPNASLYASLAGYITNIPVRLYCQWGMAYVGFAGVKRTIFKLEEKLVCSLSTWIEPDSNSNLKFSHEEGLYPSWKGSVVWNGSACGVDFNKFDVTKKELFNQMIRKERGIPNDGFVFGFVGRITGDKGINELLSATKEIFSEYQNVWLMLVGNEEITDSVDKDLYLWAVNHKHVIFTGYTLEVEKYISAMNCYVLPSYREGFGMSVVEAEAMGVPVIITNIPGPTDGMVKDFTGLIVNKKDAADLKNAMKRMYLSPELCKDFSHNGIEYVKESFDQIELFEKMYMDRMDLIEKSVLKWSN